TCPATRNQIDTKNTVIDFTTLQRNVLDLEDNAKAPTPNGSPRDATNGTSYEVLGSIKVDDGTGRRSNGTKVSLKVLLSFADYNYSKVAPGYKPGSSQVWIFFDSDDGGPDGTLTGNNVIDDWDNHRAAGGNATYCDGHASWVTRRDWRRQWNITRDANLMPDPLP
ncbi:MAG TPA: hypothetical protein VHH88_00235, partial [Verrucomicrobiae bacterium]|nr:hypothetical protein [Verrucomicrobiae bacterium]